LSHHSIATPIPHLHPPIHSSLLICPNSRTFNSQPWYCTPSIHPNEYNNALPANNPRNTCYWPCLDGCIPPCCVSISNLLCPIIFTQLSCWSSQTHLQWYPFCHLFLEVMATSHGPDITTSTQNVLVVHFSSSVTCFPLEHPLLVADHNLCSLSLDLYLSTYRPVLIIHESRTLQISLPLWFLGNGLGMKGSTLVDAKGL
jgi:hypothetical protein